MSDFDSNPFADPDLNNPFKIGYMPSCRLDPSVTQVTRNVPPGLDEYNPFSDSRTPISAPPSAATCYAAYPVILYLVFMAGWRLLPLLPALDSSSSFPCPAFLAIAKSETDCFGIFKQTETEYSLQDSCVCVCVCVCGEWCVLSLCVLYYMNGMCVSCLYGIMLCMLVIDVGGPAYCGQDYPGQQLVLGCVKKQAEQAWGASRTSPTLYTSTQDFTHPVYTSTQDFTHPVYTSTQDFTHPVYTSTQDFTHPVYTSTQDFTHPVYTSTQDFTHPVYTSTQDFTHPVYTSTQDFTHPVYTSTQDFTHPVYTSTQDFTHPVYTSTQDFTHPVYTSTQDFTHPVYTFTQDFIHPVYPSTQGISSFPNRLKTSLISFDYHYPS
ncbi:hypothetical protein STEG23_001990 [Scotinomys teguina]